MDFPGGMEPLTEVKIRFEVENVFEAAVMAAIIRSIAEQTRTKKIEIEIR